MLQTSQMVVEKEFGVVDGILGAHEDKRHTPLFPGHGGLGLVVALNFHADHTGLVNNFLDESTVLAYYFAHKISRYLRSSI